MSKNLYITASETLTGKSMITLGLMEILSKKIKNIGFFRPIVQSSEVMDNNIKFISSGYNLNLKYEEMYGLTNDQMLSFLQISDIAGMYSAILEKYKQLEKKCDFILIEGSDFQSRLSTYEFGFNLDIANNLGCPIISIVSGLDKNNSQITESVQIMKQVLHQKKCTQVGIIVNRAESVEIANIEQILSNTLSDHELGFVIPEDKKQIANAINLFKANVNTQKLGDRIESIK